MKFAQRAMHSLQGYISATAGMQFAYPVQWIQIGSNAVIKYKVLSI